MRKSKDMQLLLEEVKTLSKILICVCVIKAATEHKPQSPEKMCLLLTRLNGVLSLLNITFLDI